MIQRLPIALAQVKAGNTSQKLLNEIRQIINSLYRSKVITKKVCNNIMNWNKGIMLKWRLYLWILRKSKTSDPHRVSLNLADKIDLRRKDKYIAFSSLSIYYT